jgi:hypothetical protein
MTDEAAFVPAVSRRRFAGWTPVRQTKFIAVLARGHGVCDAAAAAGLSQRSAVRISCAATPAPGDSPLHGTPRSTPGDCS